MLGALLAAALAAAPNAPAQPIREGLWRLNVQRSVLPVARRQLMWVIKSDGDAFVFTVAQSEAGAPITVVSWSGRLDGVARATS